MNDDVLLQRLEERDADCARVAAENAALWEEVQALREAVEKAAYCLACGNAGKAHRILRRDESRGGGE